jgi:hypothetical protein
MIDKIKHTPGPWELTESRTGFATQIWAPHPDATPYEEKIHIADVAYPCAVWGTWEEPSVERKERCRHNALIISAAPEMLQACEATAQCITDFLELYKRGCSNIVMDEAVKSLRDDALAKTIAALERVSQAPL